jgi:hypothetical protein
LPCLTADSQVKRSQPPEDFHLPIWPASVRHTIASRRRISPSTVDNTRARAMEKLGATKATIFTRAVIKARISSLKDKLTAAERRLLQR